MNTEIKYNTLIKVEKANTLKGYVVRTNLNEESYKILIRAIEVNKFVTVMDINQDSITIPVNDIIKIETKIDVESDIEITEEE